MQLCTEFCPSYLLGYDAEPNKVMRTWSYEQPGGDAGTSVLSWLRLRPCTLSPVPRLIPKEACDQCKRPACGGRKFVQQKPSRFTPMRVRRGLWRSCGAGYRARSTTGTPVPDVQHHPAIVRIKCPPFAGREPTAPPQQGLVREKGGRQKSAAG